MLSRRRLLALASTSAGAALAGCSRGPDAQAPGAPRSPATSVGGSPGAHPPRPGAGSSEGAAGGGAAATPERGAALVDRLRAAFVSANRDAFVALAVPALRTRMAVLFDNWRSLASVDLSHRVSPGGGAGDLVVRWRVGRESLAAEHALALELAASSGVGSSPGPAASDALADLSDAGRHAASWSRHPVVVASDGPVSVVSAVRDLTAPTLAAAAWAAARVTEAGLHTFGWDGALVVEVPADLVEFARLGNSSLPLAGIVAYSLSTTRESAYRVVLNPAHGLLGDDLRGILLHEAVHAATRAMWLDAPLWAVEGLAESVATEHWPGQAARNAELVRASAASATALPTAEELSAVGQPGNAAYALAEVALEAMVERWGAVTVQGWVADWSAPDRPDDATLTATYLAALPR